MSCTCPRASGSLASHPPTVHLGAPQMFRPNTGDSAPATCCPKVTPWSLPSLLRISTHQLCRCTTSLGLPAPNFIHNAVRVHEGLTGAPGKGLMPPVNSGPHMEFPGPAHCRTWHPRLPLASAPPATPAHSGSSPPHQLHRGDFPQPPFLSLPHFSLLPTDSKYIFQISPSQTPFSLLDALPHTSG